MISTHNIASTPRCVSPVVLDARGILPSAPSAPSVAPMVLVPARAAPVRRVRVLGEVAPQRRLLRGPTTSPLTEGATVKTPAASVEQRFVSNMEVLDTLLARAHDRLMSRLSRLGLRRGQAQRFVVAATGRLLRAAQHVSDLADFQLAAEVAGAVSLGELAARAGVSGEQAERGLQVVLTELTAVLVNTRN